MHGLSQSHPQHTALASQVQPLKDHEEALSDPSSSQAQKQLPTLSAPREATKRPCVPLGCQNLYKPTPSTWAKPPSTPGWISTRLVAQTTRLTSASALSIIFRCQGGFDCLLVSSLILGASFSAAPWYHITSCIKASVPNCRRPTRFLAPPLDFGAPVPFAVDKSKTYHFSNPL